MVRKGGVDLNTLFRQCPWSRKYAHRSGALHSVYTSDRNTLDRYRSNWGEDRYTLPKVEIGVSRYVPMDSERFSAQIGMNSMRAFRGPRTMRNVAMTTSRR